MLDLYVVGFATNLGSESPVVVDVGGRPYHLHHDAGDGVGLPPRFREPKFVEWQRGLRVANLRNDLAKRFFSARMIVRWVWSNILGRISPARLTRLSARRDSGSPMRKPFPGEGVPPSSSSAASAPLSGTS